MLNFVDIRASPLSGSLPTECGTTSVLLQLQTLTLIDVPVEGTFPDCIWDIQNIAIANTAIAGALGSPTADSPILHLTLSAVCSLDHSPACLTVPGRCVSPHPALLPCRVVLEASSEGAPPGATASRDATGLHACRRLTARSRRVWTWT